MYKLSFAILTTLSTILLSPNILASSDPLIGTWKTIDNRTGYSLSDIRIQKLKDGRYKATILAIRAVPGTALQTTCSQCTGALKNKPLIGFSPLYNFKVSHVKSNEFIDGKYIDPITGLEYTSHIRLSNNGKHLLIRNTTANSNFSSNLTWVKY